MSTTRSNSGGDELSGAILGPQQPWHMSLAELAIALSLHEPGTVRSAAVEEELRRRLLRDKGVSQRTPPTVAFLIGALVTMTAIQVGAVMRGAPAFDKRADASSHMSQQAPYFTSGLRRD